MSREKILVVDDDLQVLKLLESLLGSHNFDVTTACDGRTALGLAAKDEHAAAIIDLNMPGLSGMETIRRLKEIRPDIEVIIFTGNPSIQSSIDAIREHVFDYFCKPGDMTEMLEKVRRAVERRNLILENRDLLRQLEMERNRLKDEVSAAKRAIEHRLRNTPDFVGQSAVAKEIRHQVAGVAPSNVNVLLLGESGTGKDVIAKMIHDSSGRTPNGFVKINCPAIPESLLESELFGHESGAFTGATERKPGRFELASGGTVFLDEIGELPLPLQSKLLQAVEQKQFYSVGGRKPIHIDVRIIAATNAPLASMIDEGKFRADLFYRLNEYTIDVPPLRERKEDIPLLVTHFLEAYRKQFNCSERIIPPETLSLLCAYPWPGNVRELQSVIRRFALTGQHDRILRTVSPKAADSLPKGDPPPVAGKALANLREHGEDLQIILEALAQTKWNRRKAAKKLGISYSTLRRRISQFGLNNA